MRIKIECTQQEFAGLVRACERIYSGYSSSCSCCVLHGICTERDETASIEHVVEVALVEGGASDG